VPPVGIEPTTIRV